MSLKEKASHPKVPKRKWERNQEEQLGVLYLDEALKLSKWTASGLEWRKRPRHHFKSAQYRDAWNTRLAGKAAGKKIKTASGRPSYVINLNGHWFMAHRVLKLLLQLEMDRRLGLQPKRKRASYYSMADRVAEAKEQRERRLAEAGLTNVSLPKRQQTYNTTPKGTWGAMWRGKTLPETG